MGWRRAGHRKRLGTRRHNWTRFGYRHHHTEERDRSDVASESRNRQARPTAMARGHFLGRWRQFKLNQDARLAQLAWSAPPPPAPATWPGAPRSWAARLMARSWSARS